MVLGIFSCFTAKTKPDDKINKINKISSPNNQLTPIKKGPKDKNNLGI